MSVAAVHTGKCAGCVSYPCVRSKFWRQNTGKDHRHACKQDNRLSRTERVKRCVTAGCSIAHRSSWMHGALWCHYSVWQRPVL